VKRAAVPHGVMTAVGFALIGVALVAAALAANQRWLDRHFLPSFFLPRRQYVQIQTIVRVGLGTIGVSLVFASRYAARLLTAQTLRRGLHVALAAVLAVAASEFVLRHWFAGPSEWLHAEDEPLRQPDPRLGWKLVPGRVGDKTIGGDTVEYAIDPAGYSV